MPRYIVPNEIAPLLCPGPKCSFIISKTKKLYFIAEENAQVLGLVHYQGCFATRSGEKFLFRILTVKFFRVPFSKN